MRVLAQDFFYCKYNGKKNTHMRGPGTRVLLTRLLARPHAGYLRKEVVDMKRNYSALYDWSVAKCAELDLKYAIKQISYSTVFEHYPGPENSASSTTAADAEWIAAWTCAMGGPRSCAPADRSPRRAPRAPRRRPAE